VNEDMIVNPISDETLNKIDMALQPYITLKGNEIHAEKLPLLGWEKPFGAGFNYHEFDWT
jgi:hypothetical protein